MVGKSLLIPKDISYLMRKNFKDFIILYLGYQEDKLK